MKNVPAKMKRVLVLDDDAMIREMLAELLGFRGYEAVSVSSADEAECLAAGVDAVILDIRLGPRGSESTKVIGTLWDRHWADVPVIVFSGCSNQREEIDVRYGSGRTVFAMVNKGRGPGELLDCLDSCFAHS